ncbi:GntR family transcriptional regulator [Leucobacter muris]|uniref:GntR family transcriptional regulator n=1 Tax=Leucobacter muris TaxID=1935379 RepID=A0ABX5QDW0_9MICO|nr:GntR family transcriptional regulator [Leucobacter muris]QAB17249.1 GntR family transcriptional regulator [Leucobacter muris]
MSRTRSGTTDEDALEAVRDLLTTGQLRPGQAIRQVELAERLGVSRVPVREALKTLEAVGLLQHTANRSYIVSKLSFREIEEIYRLREILESDAIRQTLAQGASRQLIWKMEQAHERELAAPGGDIILSTKLNREFHFPLFDGATAAQVRLIRQLWDCTDPYRILYYENHGHLESALAEHTEILEAVKTGDAELVIALSDSHRQRGINQLAPIVE